MKKGGRNARAKKRGPAAKPAAKKRGAAAQPATSATAAGPTGPRRGQGSAALGNARKRRKSADEDMYSSYGRLEIHEAMLKDRPRTDAYRRAIVAGRKEHFLGKTVLDVGCGLGILSLFAARLGGAKRVYAVEACAETALRARKVVAANGLSGVIKVICGEIETVVLPSKVDTVVSEWMGYFLLHESMLDSVLFARDRWLRKGGAMYPSRARLLAAPGDFRRQVQEKTDYWSKNVYGFDFTSLQAEVEAKVRADSPLCTHFLPAQLLERCSHVVADWDLAARPRSDVRSVAMDAPCVSRAPKASVVNGFAVWFDVHCPTTPPVVLKTGPRDPKTHWGQTIALVDQALSLRKGQGMDWRLFLSENRDNHRFYDLSLDYGLLEDND